MPAARSRPAAGAPAAPAALSLPILLLCTLLLLPTAAAAAAAAASAPADAPTPAAIPPSSSSNTPVAADAGDATAAAASKAAAQKHAEHHWHSAQQRLQSLRLDDHQLGDFLRHITGSHQYVLPLEQVQKGLVYTGSNFRLRKVIHDLILGKRPLKIGAIGGSITNGAKASKIGETDWFSLVGSYLTTAFQRANITTRNGALPATPSALMNMCLEQYVDADTDLVFVEYVANDGSNRFDEVKAKVYERLLRKLLNQPSRPAVVLLQLMPKGMAYGADMPEKAPFYATLEDVYGAQAQYYDLPWLSFRNAMWRLGALNVHGYTWTDFMWDVDLMHPTDPGMAAIADMVVHLVQQTALGLLLNPLSRADKTLLQEGLPPPMFKGNWEAKNLMCTYGEGFKPLVDSAASSGWEFINEGKPGAPKFGFISTQPGSVLKIKVNSVRDQEVGGAAGARGRSAVSSQQGVEGEGGSSDGSSSSKPMNVMLAYLKSYVGMGMASFECTSGCTCEPRKDIDALHSLQQSTIYLVRLLVSQAEECEISVTLSNKTRSEGHKFKVSGIMMNEYIGKDVTEKLHEEQWLSQLQETAREGGERGAVGSSSGSSSDAPAASSGGEGGLKAVAKESLGGGQQTAVAAAASTASGGGGASSSSSDKRRQHKRHLLSGLARRLQRVQQQFVRPKRAPY